MNMNRPVRILNLITFLGFALLTEPASPEPLSPIVKTVDLDLGESKKVTLYDGSIASIEVLDVEPVTDPVTQAVRQVQVTVLVNGEQTTIQSGNYHLPVEAGGLQLDSPVTSHYLELASQDSWALEKDVRVRLWPQN
ncbi:MAG: hypothetical protein WDZ53_01055, partial [Balneolales bacterium]